MLPNHVRMSFKCALLWYKLCRVPLYSMTQHITNTFLKRGCFNTILVFCFKLTETVKHEKGPQLCNLHCAIYH